MRNKIQTTLHISDEVRDAFKRIAAAQKRDMSEVVEELMKSWTKEHSGEPRRERAQLDQAVSLLSTAVCDQLMRNTQWAMEAVIGAGMGRPGSRVFDRRLSHFSDEKQELGKRFSHWILLRSIQYLNKGTQVVLVCESGTTIFWVLKAFAEVIDGYFTATQTKKKLAGLTIVTNNIPAAESFVTYGFHHSVSLDSGSTRISDMIDCRILAGTFLPEYVAITGDDTNRDLENYAKQRRGQEKVVFIGVTTGNWVTVSEGGLHFLDRGRGHGAFKQTLFAVCDEIFAVAPLGKVLVNTSPETLNETLGLSPKASNPLERSYQLIETPPKKAKATKLVSTTRLRQSVLRDHSAILRKALGVYATFDEVEPSSPIEAVAHLLFDFDKFSDETPETQVEIELPHGVTRSASLKENIFSIRTLK